MTKTILGIIGGSGVYDITMENARWERVDSPWGEASDALRMGEIDGLPVVFLPRHGRGHVYSPSTINYRANIDCLKRAGVTDVVSLSAVEALSAELWPQLITVVVSLPDARKGERLALLTTDATCTRDAFSQFAKRKGVTELSVPADILIVDKIPLLGSGKPDYVAALNLAKERLASKSAA